MTQPRAKSKPERSYFATPDPMDASRITYWYRSKRGSDTGKLRPWPPKSHPYRLQWSDMPDERHAMTPANTEFARAFWAKARAASDAAKQAIENDLIGTSDLFARLKIACCCCGRGLTDERSVVLGIGPECRQGMPPDLADRLVDAVGRAHAKTLFEASAP
jgi:hypothetical protein